MRYFPHIITILISYFCINPILKAQEINGHDFAFYADVAMNANEASHRKIANDQMYDMMLDVLEAKSFHQLDLDTIKWIYHISPPDSSFSLVSWQLEMEAGHSQYSNFIVLPSGEYFELHGGDDELLIDAEYASFYPDECLSMLYYRIEPIKGKKGKIDSYMLFGFKQFDQYENIKVIEVLSFQDGEPVFGKEIFQAINPRDGELEMKNRLILKYANDANVNFRHESGSDLIMYDHLIQRMGRLAGQGPTLLPDGSYEGFILKDGIWSHQSKMFDQILEEAPTPEPILDKEQKSIFGKSSNK